jgi:lysophospholipase L1-like esterase
LRAAAPDAAILLIGAPNSAKKKGAGENVGCRYRLPAGLKTVQNIQQDVAISEHLLFWSWESAMGGRCSMQRFVDSNPPLGRPDYIHFTEEGYARGGNAFFEALMQKYQKSRPKR